MSSKSIARTLARSGFPVRVGSRRLGSAAVSAYPAPTSNPAASPEAGTGCRTHSAGEVSVRSLSSVPSFRALAARGTWAAAALVALALLHGRLQGPLATWVLHVALAPWVEELVFRRGLQEALLRAGLGGGRAIAATAALFAVAHGVARSWWLAAGVLAPALLIGVLYARRRRVGPCVALHAALNAACLLGAPQALQIWPFWR